MPTVLDPPDAGLRTARFVAVTVATKDPRREARYRLRWLLRDVTSLGKRVEACGMPLGVSDVATKLSADRVAHYAGLMTCGNIWACPVCSAKIRAARAAEISQGLSHLISDEQGGALFVTLTLPHEADDALSRTIELVSEGFSAVQRGRPYSRERDEYGIIGHIRSFEVTHGHEHGWHPHLHVAVCLSRPGTPRVAGELRAGWQARWDRWLIRQNWPASADGIGVRVQVVRTTADLADYIAKVQDGKLSQYRADKHAGWELARADLKVARESGHRMPFEILAAFGTDGLAADLDLWHEYEAATKGRSSIRWSKGLRSILLPDAEELTDEQIAAAEQDGEVIALIRNDLWRLIEKRPGLSARLLTAAEQGGFREMLALLAGSGLPTEGLLRAVPDSGAECR